MKEDVAARQALERMISDAESALQDSLTHGASATDIERHDKSLQALDRLLHRFPKKKSPPWLLPLSVAVVAVSLVGLAAGIRIPRPFIVADARVFALTITAAADGTGLSSDVSVPVNSIEVVGGSKQDSITGPSVSISAFKLKPGTTALFEQLDSCLEIQIPVTESSPEHTAQGIELIVLHPPKEKGQLPTPATWHASPGATITICGNLPKNYAISGGVQRVDLYRHQPGEVLRGFVDMYFPSIISGNLRLPNFNRSLDLQDTDMVSLDGIRDGWSFIFLTPPMRVVVTGAVDHPAKLSPTPRGGATSLEPTLLEWITKSPLITSVFGLVSGLVGVLWALGRYFGLLPR